MSLIIDGHNLIGKMPGIQLSDIDDEQRLVEILITYCRLTRKKAEVFFDNAPPGQARTRRFGAVGAHYIQAGRTADDAIQSYLKRQGRAARNLTVVSSDQSVQNYARWAGAHTLPAEAFSRQVLAQLRQKEAPEIQESQPLDPQEVEEWLDLFGGEEDTSQ